MADPRTYHYIWVAGNRDYPDDGAVESWFSEVVDGFDAPGAKMRTVIIHGGARGVDRWADVAAKRRAMLVGEFPAYGSLWDTFRGAAGHMRNSVLCDLAHELVAFHDGRESGGTHKAIEMAQRKGIFVTVIAP